MGRSADSGISPGPISFSCVPYARPVATAWLCLAFWQTGLESQQTLQTT